MIFSRPNFALWRKRQWGMVLAALLLVTLAPLGWIQWRQFHVLDDLSVRQVDSLMWQAYQLEREAGRLKQSLVDAGDPSTPVDPWALTERYEVFLSRINLIVNIPRRDLLAESPPYNQALQSVNDFAQSAESAFSSPEALLSNTEARLALINRIGAMQSPLAELTREANRAVARFVDERNQQLRQQSLLVMGLTTVQIMVMLLLVWLLVRHIRRQQAQFAELQTMSQALEVALDQAESANRGKSIFLANMSHEIRTPFQGLLGMLNLLDYGSLNNQQRDYLQTANDSAMHLLGVLNDILDVSTMESGTMKLSLAPVHLMDLVQEVEGLMVVSARDKGLTLNMYVAANLPQWVNADATRLRQIMFNLITNAIKFTQKGGIMAELTADPQDPSTILFSVRDSGVGMDAETLERLFTRFYQADNSLRRRIGGTGLGLEISRNLARMMDGDISVQSTAGEGSTFTARLKLQEAQAPEIEPSVRAGLDGARRLNLLVAEDHPINLKYMNALLNKMGHDATFCENGHEALQLIDRGNYDAVLLDYHMPVLDGMATTQAIRALEGPKSDIKIILITADVVNDTRKRAHEVGVNEVATKPLQLQDLERALARCGLLEASPHGSGHGPLPSSLSPLSSSELPVRLPDAAPAPSAYIDSESFLEILDMMPSDSLTALLTTVFDAPEGTVHVLAKAISQADRESIGYNAHKLKGVAMLMGFRKLVSISSQIELLATQTTDPIDGELARKLVQEASQTKAAIDGFEQSAAL